MPSKAQRITGWVVTGLVGFFLLVASGVPKFIDFPGKNVGDQWFFPIIIGVVMWIALGLRQPAIFALALGKSPWPSNPEGNTP